MVGNKFWYASHLEFKTNFARWCSDWKWQLSGFHSWIQNLVTMVMLCGYDQETEDAKEKREIIEITKIQIYQPENQHGIHYDCHRLPSGKQTQQWMNYPWYRGWATTIDSTCWLMPMILHIYIYILHTIGSIYIYIFILHTTYIYICRQYIL